MSWLLLQQGRLGEKIRGNRDRKIILFVCVEGYFCINISNICLLN